MIREPYRSLFSVLLLGGLFCGTTQAAGVSPEEPQGLEHGERPNSVWIRDVMVIKGNGTPPFGPTHVVLRGGRIESVGQRPPKGAEVVVDGRGLYLMPGLINMHGHIQESRAGINFPREYQMNLWLSCGITTIRDLGSKFELSLKLKEQSEEGVLQGPRIFLYPFVSGVHSPDEMQKKVRELHRRGADGLKLYSMDRDLLEAALEEAHQLGLRTTIHVGVEETNAWDVARLGLTSIEHWYGVPDAALDGVQSFPPDFSYSNEAHRFRWAGRLWREVNPEKLDRLLDTMVHADLAWDPTFAIYEASRDVTRAQNKPWFEDYLHPALARFFSPNQEYHGSYFMGWTNTDEVYWKENYRIWMQAVREFARRGGTVTTGEDGGFIYVMYGFGLLRELELHEEAGFHPLEVITHATSNGAEVLGKADLLGRIRPGHAADLILVNGNPVENLRLLYPTGALMVKDGKPYQTGGIEWTFKDGIPYHVPTMMKRVAEIVAEARAELDEKEIGGE